MTTKSDTKRNTSFVKVRTRGVLVGLNGNVGALVSFTGDKGGICIWPGGGLKFKSNCLNLIKICSICMNVIIQCSFHAWKT